MKHLNTWKLFESINIQGDKESINHYLMEMGITPDELNDIFSLVSGRSYLQLFYLDENGGQWSSLESAKKVYKLSENIIPFLSISFTRDFSGKEITLKNSDSGKRINFSDDIGELESFTDALFRLKSMYPNSDIYWQINSYVKEVRIYFKFKSEI